MKRPFTAGTDDAGRRLESVVRRMLPDLPLSAVHKALRGGDIRLNGAKAGPEARVAEGDTIAVLNEQSKRTVQGVVAGPGRVVISASTPQLAANLPVRR